MRSTAIETSERLTTAGVRTRVAPGRAWMAVPWRDHGGRFSWLKALVFLAVFIPGLVLAAQWATGNAGARPVTFTIDGCGLWAVRFLLITLAVTPLRRLANWPRVVLLRRMLGLTALCYVLAHFSLYIVDQNFHLGTVATEIALRVYLTIGFVVLLGLCALGATSTDGVMRRMKRNWKRLHRLLYVLVPLGILHFFMQSKADVSQAVLVGGFFIWLMLWRALPARWNTRLVPLVGVAAASGLAAAGIEYAWYGIATHINPARVLAANLDVALGIRPAVWVAIAGLAIAFLAALRQRGAALPRWARV
jgi:methionine sulfoxide reductase heme-binding subunit